jgi:hypothetical protein
MSRDISRLGKGSGGTERRSNLKRKLFIILLVRSRHIQKPALRRGI